MPTNLGVPPEAFAPTDDIPTLAGIEPVSYYSERGVLAGSEMAVPTTLTASLDKFYALPISDQQRFIRACYCFNHARVTFSYSQSASFMALINAIETLIPQTKGEPHCKECGRPIHSVVSRFKDFMEKYTNDLSEEAKAERQRLYDIRSSLSHGDYLLHADIEVVWGMEPSSEQERQAHERAWRWTRIAMVNWLHSR